LIAQLAPLPDGLRVEARGSERHQNLAANTPCAAPRSRSRERHLSLVR
jgi:hypothetical protein